MFRRVVVLLTNTIEGRSSTHISVPSCSICAQKPVERRHTRSPHSGLQEWVRILHSFVREISSRCFLSRHPFKFSSANLIGPPHHGKKLKQAEHVFLRVSFLANQMVLSFFPFRDNVADTAMNHVDYARFVHLPVLAAYRGLTSRLLLVRRTRVLAR